MSRSPKSLIIIGQSGAGKSTIVAALQGQAALQLIPTWTDRPRRAGEMAGEQHFVTSAQLDIATSPAKDIL